ncbi:NAD-binding protein [uncultured Faecalibaculum sp.]|uniref:NAD-binding protein n=1 Tax=uncultured Faecalibaculum sp. TaxID=1729681 RepID=UPI0025D17E80|nr:NAD-binding protein [uncultured Faecalibaculum sp.]
MRAHGALLARSISEQGGWVTVIDRNPDAFTRLPASFSGSVMEEDGMPIQMLEEAGAGSARALAAVTDDEDVNIMWALMARILYDIPVVLCRIKEEALQEIVEDMGIECICPVQLGTETMLNRLEASL